MKNSVITFLFLTISFCCLAQTSFTEQTLLDMNKRMMQDFPKFMSEEVSPDYTFTTEDGAVISYQTMKDFKIKVLEWHTYDLKIKQIGNAAIVRGINKNTIQSFTSGAIRHYNLQFMYTYEYKNGKWLWFSSHHIYNNPSKADEETAIKKVLDEQVAAVYAGDVAVIQKFYKDDPKAFHIVSGTAGEFLLRDNESIKSNQKLAKPRNGTPIRSNYNIKIVGNIATAHYDQENTSSNGEKRYEHNLHILEKVNNEWKIFGASIHPSTFSKYELDDEVEILKQFVVEYNKDATAFFMDRCPENFRYTNGKGKFSDKNALKSDKTHTSDSEVSDLKVFRSLDLAVISGMHTWRNKQADNNVKVNKVAFTYTMEKKNGKWLFSASHHTPVQE